MRFIGRKNYYSLQSIILVIAVISLGYSLYSYYTPSKPSLPSTTVAALTEETKDKPEPVSGAVPPTGGFGLSIDKPTTDGPSRHPSEFSRYSAPKPYKSPLALSKADSEEKQELKEPVPKKVVEKPVTIDQKQESNFEKYLQLAANISSILFPLMGMTLSLMLKRSQLKELRADKNKLRSKVIDNEDIPFTF
jgi:hypothetical protein